MGSVTPQYVVKTFVASILSAGLLMFFAIAIYGTYCNYRLARSLRTQPSAQPFVLTVHRADGTTVKKWSEGDLDFVLVTSSAPDGPKLMEFFVTRRNTKDDSH